MMTIFFQRNGHLKTTETRTYYYDFLAQWLIGVHIVRGIERSEGSPLSQHDTNWKMKDVLEVTA